MKVGVEAVLSECSDAILQGLHIPEEQCHSRLKARMEWKTGEDNSLYP